MTTTTTVRRFYALVWPFGRGTQYANSGDDVCSVRSFDSEALRDIAVSEGDKLEAVPASDRHVRGAIRRDDVNHMVRVRIETESGGDFETFASELDWLTPNEIGGSTEYDGTKTTRIA